MRETFDAVLLVDQFPQDHHSGAASYNAAVLRAIRALGWRVLILVAGRRFDRIAFRIPTDDPGVTVRFAHALPLGGGRFVVPSVLPVARYAKRRLSSRRPSASPLGKRVKIERFPAKREIDTVRRMLGSVEAKVVFVDTIFRAPYVPEEVGGARTVLVGHDVFHERVASFEANGFEVTPRVDARMEGDLVSRFDAILAISDADAATYGRLSPRSAVATLYPAVPAGPLERRIDPRSGRVLYIGSSAHHNVDGLRWFLEKVWPNVLAARAGAVLDVVGSIGSLFEGHPNVVCWGRVDDLGSLTHRPAVAVNPVRMGSGIKIKMVDYFREGLGCVTTRVGAHGFPVEGAPFLLADDEEEFAAQLVACLNAPDVCMELSQRTEAYLRHFSPEAAAQAVLRCADGSLAGAGVS